uniref:Ovule protein n=1 Tax=Strongyloides venezuelensis TaxID=75913 RepID=A0A0K0FMQ1_STRVS
MNYDIILPPFSTNHVVREFTLTTLFRVVCIYPVIVTANDQHSKLIYIPRDSICVYDKSSCTMRLFAISDFVFFGSC